MSYVRELTRTQKAEQGLAKATAALTNEQLTRQRVERLEKGLNSMTILLRAQTDPLRRGLWGRLRWLLTGK